MLLFFGQDPEIFCDIINVFTLTVFAVFDESKVYLLKN